MIKTIIKKYFKHFSFFYSYLKNRILLSLIFSVIVGFLDGIGLLFFLPLLMSDSKVPNITSEDSSGTFDFLGDWISSIGVNFSFGQIIFLVIGVFVFKNFIRFIEKTYAVFNQRYFVVKIRKQCIHLFRDYKYSSYTKSDSGRIQNTFTEGIVGVIAGYRNYFNCIQSVLVAFVYIVLACLSNFSFAIMILLSSFLTMFLFRYFYTKTKEISRKITGIAHGFQGSLIQFVAFFKYLKSTGKINAYSNRIEQIIDKAEVYNRKMGMMNALLAAIREPIVIAIIMLGIYWQVVVLEHSIMPILLSIIMLLRALNVMMTVQTSWNGFLQSTGALENFQNFTNDLKNQTERYGKLKFEKLQHNLQLIDISFNYDEGETILKNINLTIPKNQTIAFVGESGSGKTTTVNLLAGLFQPVKGKYLIDSVDVREIDVRQFQSKIGYITQESIIFDDTIFNNVTFWAEPTSENLEKFWKAMDKAAITKFVLELPDKENTRLGANGIMVSGGQKQRISIARELYKDIDVLIMDEATSALDSETENAIQENINALKGKYTIIIVAHRLSTIKNADQIVLMEKGKIIDIADFETLRSKNTYFNRMVSLQEV